MFANCSEPLRGGVGMKWYSARAPRRATCHGTPCSRMTSRAPSDQRSPSGSIRANASSVRTSVSVARMAAIERAFPASVPPTPPTSASSSGMLAEIRSPSASVNA